MFHAMEQRTVTQTRSKPGSTILVAGALVAGAAGIALALSILSGSNTTTHQTIGSYLDLAAGYHTACVVKADTTVWCWGEQANFYNTTQPLPSQNPVQVKLSNGAPLTGVRSLAFGKTPNGPYCAVKTDGTVWCWGKDQLSTTENANVFSQVHPVMANPSALLTDVVKVAVGDNNSCAIKKDLTGWCWGRDYGYIGASQTVTKPAWGMTGVYPTLITNGTNNEQLQNVIDMSANLGYFMITNSTGGVKKTWAWGNPTLISDLNVGKTTPVPAPTAVFKDNSYAAPIPGLTQISSGFNHTCAVDINHTAICWGGCAKVNGVTPPGCLPTAVAIGPLGPGDAAMFTDVVSVTAGTFTDCVIRGGGSLWCWGQSLRPEQTSGGTSLYTKTPQEILYQGNSMFGLTKVVMGNDFACAMKMNNTIFCWGNNSFKQLGPSVPEYSSGSNSPAIFPQL